MKYTIGDLHEVSLFVQSCSITKDMLDELKHANYNELKKVFENVRHRLCKHLGFGRKILRKRLGLGLFVVEDHYLYHKPLKLGDHIFFIAKVKVGRAPEVIIELRAIRICIEDPSKPGTSIPCEIELTDTITYRHVLTRLKTGKPTRIPEPMIRSIESFTALMKELNSCG